MDDQLHLVGAHYAVGRAQPTHQVPGSRFQPPRALRRTAVSPAGPTAPSNVAVTYDRHGASPVELSFSTYITLQRWSHSLMRPISTRVASCQINISRIQTEHHRSTTRPTSQHSLCLPLGPSCHLISPRGSATQTTSAPTHRPQSRLETPTRSISTTVPMTMVLDLVCLAHQSRNLRRPLILPLVQQCLLPAQRIQMRYLSTALIQKTATAYPLLARHHRMLPSPSPQ